MKKKLKLDAKHNYGFTVISKREVAKLFRSYKKWMKFINKYGIAKAREINYSPISNTDFSWAEYIAICSNCPEPVPANHAPCK
jgi:hypothetical protein